MSTFQVAWNPGTRVAKIQLDGAIVGAGFTDIGSFDHIGDPDDELGSDHNHVFYHHVRDLLYKQGVLDMQRVKITNPVVSIDTLPATKTLDLSDGESIQLATTFTPAYASNTRLTYASSDVTKATVDAGGRVRAVAVGTATITVTSVDSGVTDTVAITVQA